VARPSRKTQFRLQTLLFVVAVFCTSMGVFGPYGFVFASLVVVAIAVARIVNWNWRKLTVVGSVLSALFLIGWLIYQLSNQPGCIIERRSSCLGRLRNLVCALHQYHQDHGSFPPVYIPDEDGKPMHSWRVLLLPYLEQEGLYAQYNFNEPWNGPSNRTLASQMSADYACPADPEAGRNTSYLAVVGQKAAWHGSEPVKKPEISDPASTIMLVEVADSGINWMEPRDLSFEQALAGVNPAWGTGISSKHVHKGGYFFHDEPAGACVAFVDGSAQLLDQRIPPETLEALLTANGGETVDWESLRYEVPKRIHWPRVLAVVALVVSVVLLVWCVWRRGVIVFVDRKGRPEQAQRSSGI